MTDLPNTPTPAASPLTSAERIAQLERERDELREELRDCERRLNHSQAVRERLRQSLLAERAALAEIQQANAELREQLEQARAETAAAFDWLADELSGAQMHADCGGRFSVGDDPALVFNAAIHEAIELCEQAQARTAGSALLARLKAAEAVCAAAEQWYDGEPGMNYLHPTSPLSRAVRAWRAARESEASE
jgi:DNA repair exonuclease SbcCD ATPase subunit